MRLGARQQRQAARDLRRQRGQAAVEAGGLLVVVVAVIVLLFGLGLPQLVGHNVAATVNSVLSGKSAPPKVVSLPAAGLTSFTDSSGERWVWDPNAPGGPAWRVTHPDGSVTIVSGNGQVLSGPKLAVAGSPIVSVAQQGGATEVTLADGNTYTLLDEPEKGPDKADVQDLVNQVLKGRDPDLTYKYVQRGPDSSPDIAGYNSLKPGEPLKLFEVKSPNVGADGSFNTGTTSARIVKAVRGQDADEVDLVFSKPPDPASLQTMLQRAQGSLAEKGLTTEVTISVRDPVDGTLHEAWSGTLGQDDPTDISSLEPGQAQARADQPGDPNAGKLDPGEPDGPGGEPGEPGGGPGEPGGGPGEPGPPDPIDPIDPIIP